MSAFYRVAIVNIALSVVVSLPSAVSAQSDWTSYQLVPQTVCVKEPVTRSRWIEETVFEKQHVTSYKPIWQTEKRERTRTYRKPIRKTSLREERSIVRKPVRETKYRERRVEETTYELITEMREEQYTVQKPVIETQMREEQVTVRKKVTEDMIEVQNILRHRPVTVPQQQLVPFDVTVNRQLTMVDPNSRSRLQRLTPGYYTDPVTGQTGFRRRGLHWVQPTVDVQVADTVPMLAMQETSSTTYVPETIQRRRPVQLTRYIDSVETRKVPVTVKRMIEETRTRRVPVTVKKPITKVTIEKVPYTETRYVDEVVVRKVPVVETQYQEVTEVEPYEVQVPRWVTVTEEVEVPKVIRRRVDYTTTEEVRKTVMMKVPIDDCGIPTGPAVPLYDSFVSDSNTVLYRPSSDWTTDFGTRTENFSPLSSDSPTEVLKPTDASDESENESRYRGQWNDDATKPLSETSERRSILVPETSSPSAANPSTNLKPIVRQGSGSVDESQDPDPTESSDTPESEPATQDDEEPTTANRQNTDQITNLPISGPRDLNVPRVARPDVQPADSGDEFAAEKAAANTGIGTPELNQPN